MKITVFTPTYNRAGLLPRLYESLVAQTNYDFEWLIVDDGSVDDTRQVVEQFCQTSAFPIRYYYKENGGKHTAYNMAVEKAEGLWFVCLDSDDMLPPNAVERMCREIGRCEEINGLVAYKSDLTGKLICSELPQDVPAMKIYELGLRYQCGGDYVFAYETAMARRFPFPVFEGERFSPEGIMLDMLGMECNVAVVREVLMRCEYQEGGYSDQAYKLIRENPCAYAQCFMQKIDLSLKLKDRVMYAGRYHCYRLFAGKRSCKYNGCHKVTTMLCMPIGWLFWLYYKLLRGF